MTTETNLTRIRGGGGGDCADVDVDSSFAASACAARYEHLLRSDVESRTERIRARRQRRRCGRAENTTDDATTIMSSSIERAGDALRRASFDALFLCSGGGDDYALRAPREWMMRNAEEEEELEGDDDEAAAAEEERVASEGRWSLGDGDGRRENTKGGGGGGHDLSLELWKRRRDVMLALEVDDGRVDNDEVGDDDSDGGDADVDSFFEEHPECANAVPRQRRAPDNDDDNEDRGGKHSAAASYEVKHPIDDGDNRATRVRRNESDGDDQRKEKRHRPNDSPIRAGAASPPRRREAHPPPKQRRVEPQATRRDERRLPPPPSQHHHRDEERRPGPPPSSSSRPLPSNPYQRWSATSRDGAGAGDTQNRRVHVGENNNDRTNNYSGGGGGGGEIAPRPSSGGSRDGGGGGAEDIVRRGGNLPPYDDRRRQQQQIGGASRIDRRRGGDPAPPPPPQRRQTQTRTPQSRFNYGEGNDDGGEEIDENPFRTARELGTNFNGGANDDRDDGNNDGRGSGGSGGGRGRRPGRNGGGGGGKTGGGWEDYECDQGTGTDNFGTRGGAGPTGGRPGASATGNGPGGRPQHMVRAAIQGPSRDQNISAGLKRKFQPPKKRDGGEGGGNGGGGGPSRNAGGNRGNGGGNNTKTDKNGGGGEDDDEELPEELKNCDKEMVRKIYNEIVDDGATITFDDIAGLSDAKQTVMEMVVWPMQRPDLFTGLRAAPNGLLLFGPPGTGKTLIGKAIAHESGATFFSISSSVLTSKWIGEGEKMVRTLFAVARYRSPSVIFIDEVDSMLTTRTSDDNEASRRIKTEFLVQFDGAGNKHAGRLLVIGATNCPHDLDEAARRRFVKRLYVPLPARPDRETLVRRLLGTNNHVLVDRDVSKLARDTEGFSGADMKNLCTDAAMGPIRQLGSRAMEIDAEDVPPITYRHFRQSLRGMSSSVNGEELERILEFDRMFGNKSVASLDAEESEDDDGSDSEG